MELQLHEAAGGCLDDDAEFHGLVQEPLPLELSVDELADVAGGPHVVNG